MKCFGHKNFAHLEDPGTVKTRSRISFVILLELAWGELATGVASEGNPIGDHFLIWLCSCLGVYSV